MSINDSGKRFIELDNEILEFAINNCEVNLSQMMGMLQAVHDNKFSLSEDKITKLVDYIEKFRNLKKSLEQAK